MYKTWNDVRWAVEQLDGCLDAHGFPRDDWHGFIGALARRHAEVALDKHDPTEITEADVQAMHQASVAMHEAYMAKKARLTSVYAGMTEDERIAHDLAVVNTAFFTPAPVLTPEDRARKAREDAYNADSLAERNAAAAWDDEEPW